MGLTMVLVLNGMYLASLPPGVPVSSRGDCVSRCYRQRNCSSIFYDVSTKKCQLSGEVSLEGDLASTLNNMEYLAWRRDDCDNDYTWYRRLDHCYKIYTTTETWFQASHACHQDGGHLIKVDSAGINEWTNMVSVSYSAHIWLGGIQGDLIGQWTWLDGSVINPAYWGVGEPNTAVEKCMVVSKSRNGIGRWADVVCTRTDVHMFVCQLPLKEEPYC